VQLTGMRTKYYLLSVVAFVVAFVVLALLPTPAQAQEAPSIDKECTPNPVQVGQQITCTIVVEAAPGTGAQVTVTDMLPAGLTVTEATFLSLGVLSGPCTVADNTVTCPRPGGRLAALPGLPVEVTIEATAQQCGTFENTATAEGIVFPAGGGSAPAFGPIQSEPEQITVEGCEEAGGGGAGGGGAGGGGAGGGGAGGDATPITQEGEQESEAGEIDQTFDVS
jgi:uncharacterized repeat protein (TIGR01451 family)